MEERNDLMNIEHQSVIEKLNCFWLLTARLDTYLNSCVKVEKYVMFRLAIFLFRC